MPRRMSLGRETVRGALEDGDAALCVGTVVWDVFRGQEHGQEVDGETSEAVHWNNC